MLSKLGFVRTGVRAASPGSFPAFALARFFATMVQHFTLNNGLRIPAVNLGAGMGCVPFVEIAL